MRWISTVARMHPGWLPQHHPTRMDAFPASKAPPPTRSRVGGARSTPRGCTVGSDGAVRLLSTLAALKVFLADKGVTTSFVSELADYTFNKEYAEYRKLLEDMSSFVEKSSE